MRELQNIDLYKISIAELENEPLTQGYRKEPLCTLIIAPVRTKELNPGQRQIGKSGPNKLRKKVLLAMLSFLSLDIIDAFGQSLSHFGSLFLDRNDRPFHLPSEVFQLAVCRRLQSKTLK
jgi:hypothetical protein